jgi:FMN phosphatase YigB (HAD superfamily)
MRWLMKPLLMFKVFPNSLRLPRFLKVRERFAGQDLNDRETLLQSICNDLSIVEKTSADLLRSWILDSFYPGFVYTMKFQKNGRPGINQTLRGLKERNINLAVLSDYDSVKERLDNLGIESGHFSVTTSCEASGALKPSPRPFLQIANHWGIPPEQLIVIGDRNDTDGAAARSAGMKFIQIHDATSPSGTSMDWRTLQQHLAQLKGPSRLI